MLRRPPPPPLFPYTTLFRSRQHCGQIFRAHQFAISGSVEHTHHARAQLPERAFGPRTVIHRSEEHTSELQSRFDLVCRLLLEKTTGPPRSPSPPHQPPPTTC